MADNARDYRSEIDGLRALAVVAVIVHHFSKWLVPSGYLGVDIFFVISGYVITASLSQRHATGLGDFLVQFYTRRIKRVAPALFFYAAVTGVVLCMFDSRPIASLRTAVASLFGFSNLYLLKQASDYFGSAAELNAFTHTWSLGVEEQFYLVFPFLFWFSGYGRQRAGSGLRLSAVVATLAAASLAAFVYFSHVNQPVAFFSMPTRFWELACGSALFASTAHLPQAGAMLRRVPPLPVAAALVAVLFAPLEYAVGATIAAVLLTGLLLACLRPSTACYSVFSSAPATYVGRISYSLYLWHWGVLVLSRFTIGIHAWSAPLQIAAMAAMAMFSYHFVEVPLRRAPWSATRWRSIAYGLSGSLLVAGGLVFLQAGETSPLFTGNADTGEAPASAVVPRGTPTGTLLLLGDSHALHLDELARRTAASLNMEYKRVAQTAMPFPIARFSSPVGGLTYKSTRAKGDEVRRDADAAVAALAPGQRHLIVLSSFYRFYWDTPAGSRRFQVLSHFDEAGRPISRAESLDHWLADLQEFARANASRKIVVFLSTPEMPGIYPADLCSPQWFRPSVDGNCTKSIPLAAVTEQLAGLNSRIIKATAGIPNVVVFDPAPSLRSGDQYPSQIGGTRLYVDEDHLTRAGAARVEADFSAFLKARNLP